MTDREYREWVASLASGDEVTLKGLGRGLLCDTFYASAVVERVTPKQLVLRDARGSEYRYWRDHERWVGYSARGPGIGRLHRLTDEDRAEIRLRELRDWFEGVALAYRRDAASLSAERLEAMRNAYNNPSRPRGSYYPGLRAEIEKMEREIRR